jgi:pyridoxamine 5'-phosphate oxidase family protein
LFSKTEADYLKSQHLARIATASSKGAPEVSPVGFEYDGKHIYVGSHAQKIFFTTQRYHNVKNGNPRVSIVIDDQVSVNPWIVRGIKIAGEAEVVSHDGIFGPGKYLRITPKTWKSWGLEPESGPTMAKKAR